MFTEHVSIVLCRALLLFFVILLHVVLSFSFIPRKVKDSLPLFRQFFSSAFSLTYVSLASMKLPPDVLRCLIFSVPPLVRQLLVCVFSLLVCFSLSLLSSSCLNRALLTGLTSNPHINDLHLDISGCEVSAAAVHGIKLNQTRLHQSSSRISAQETRRIPNSDSCLRLACFSPAEICRRGCNPGTFPQSGVYRHAGHLRQR